jgi:hypothetical protein
MLKRWWMHLGLLLLVGGLIIVVLYEPGLHKDDDLNPVATVATLELEKITRIEIERRTDKVIMEKQDGHWYMRHPLALPANAHKIERILNSLNNSRSHAQLRALDVTLSDFGLNPAHIRLHVDTQIFALGDTLTLNAQRYILSADNIHVTDDILAFQLEAPAISFVHLSPLGIAPHIKALHTPYFHLRQGEEGWYAQESDLDLDNTQLQHTVSAWQNLQAFNVRPYVSGTHQGEIYISLHDHDEAIRLEIRSLSPELVLANEANGVMYEIAAQRLKELLQLTEIPPATPENNDSSLY